MTTDLQSLERDLRNLEALHFNSHKPQETAGNIRTQLIDAKQAEINAALQRASAIDLAPHSL